MLGWALLGFGGIKILEHQGGKVGLLLDPGLGWDVPEPGAVPGEMLSHQEQLPGCACLGKKPQGFNEQI